VEHVDLTRLAVLGRLVINKYMYKVYPTCPPCSLETTSPALLYSFEASRWRAYWASLAWPLPAQCSVRHAKRRPDGPPCHRTEPTSRCRVTPV